MAQKEALVRQLKADQNELNGRLTAFSEMAPGPNCDLKSLREESHQIEQLLQRFNDSNMALQQTGYSALACTGYMVKLDNFKHEFMTTNNRQNTIFERAELLPSCREMAKRGSGGAILDAEADSWAKSLMTLEQIAESGQGSRDSFGRQHQVMGKALTTLTDMAQKFPVAGNLLNKIQSRQARERVVMGTVIAILVFFTIWYILS